MRIKVSTSKREDVEIKALNARIAAESPAVGDAEATATDFAQLPISRYTCTGLEKGKFRKMTQIQRIALPHALAGYVGMLHAVRSRLLEHVHLRHGPE